MNNPSSKKYLVVLFVFILMTGMFIFGFMIGGLSNAILFSNKTVSEIQTENFESNILDEVWTQIDNLYLESNVDEQELEYGAAKGMVEALNDDYSRFLSPEETAAYQQSSGTQFEGIGAILRFDGDYTVVDTPLDGFPAQKAGIMPGDVILEVNGEKMKGENASDVAEKIKGPAGSDVNIKVYRPKDQKELDFTITRESIDIDNVQLASIEDGIAHIKISKFNESDPSVFVNLWDDIVKKIVDSDAKSIIVDLRNNPGGLVSLVQYTSEEFLDQGDIVMIEEERGGARQEFKSTRNGRLRNYDVVILVNEGSASASEIMTGALVDNGVAKVVGMPTVGKGVEQRLIDLSDGSTMHLVFRRWLMPSGRQVTKDEPITPEFEVELTTEDFEANRDPQLDKARELLK